MGESHHFQEEFDAMMKIMRNEQLAKQPKLRIQHVIEALGPLKPDDPVYALLPDKGLVGIMADLWSYRGYYQDLAIGWTNVFTPSPSIEVYKALLRAAQGQLFEGWKGGDFMMGPETILWVEFDHGNCSGFYISEIQVIDNRAILVCNKENNE
jgi:hypothetical protein